MQAILLAAGMGKRLGAGGPKCLLEFGGRSLLARHIDHLRALGLERLVLVLGYEAARVEAGLAACAGGFAVQTLYNPDFEAGSVLSLWHAREALRAGEAVLVMDADVLYDRRMLARLVRSRHENCFLLDRDLEPGEEPVKICVRDGRMVAFGKQVEGAFDYCGESVGFFRFGPREAAALAETVEAYIGAGRAAAPHEDAVRDRLLQAPPGTFGFEDVTGLPWIEIDFPADVTRAEHEILPKLNDVID